MSTAHHPYLYRTLYLVESRRPGRRYAHAGSGDLPFARRLALALAADGQRTRIIKQDVVRCIVT